MANRPPRFPDFAYAGFNRYFLTICARDRLPVFAATELGEAVIAKLLPIATEFGFDILAYCVMPDHLHALAAGQGENSLLRPFMHRFKQATGHWWKNDLGHRRQLWQEGYYDHILRDDDPNEGVIRYILENPVRARLVEDPREYPLIGAGTYDVDMVLEAAMLWMPPWQGGRRRRRV
jgi:REP element-mobilizing transposase RayT